MCCANFILPLSILIVLDAGFSEKTENDLPWHEPDLPVIYYCHSFQLPALLKISPGRFVIYSNQKEGFEGNSVEILQFMVKLFKLCYSFHLGKAICITVFGIKSEGYSFEW